MSTAAQRAHRVAQDRAKAAAAADEAENTLASLIGEAVALHLADLLSRMPCPLCVHEQQHATAGPALRETGLVDGAGRPVMAARQHVPGQPT